MSISTSISKLNEHNYRTWAIEAKDLLKHLNVGRVVDGSEIIPRPPAAPAASGSTTTPTAPNPLDPSYDFQPQSTNSSYLTHFDNFLQDWRGYRYNYEEANGSIYVLLDLSIHSRYNDDKFDDLKVLWEAIRSDFEKVIKLDGRFEMAKLTNWKLQLYPSISEWITAQEKILHDLAICDITIDDAWGKFYILSNLPNNEEGRTFLSTLELTEKADTVANITSNLLSFEATLRIGNGLSPYAGLFVMKKGCGRTSKGDSTNGERRSQKCQGIVCHGCGEKGHIQPKCRNMDKWASYAAEKKSKVNANLASTEWTPAANTESFLFSIMNPNSVHEGTVITVNVATKKQPADYWMLDTGATNQVTGNRHLFKSIHPMAKGEHQVKTANNNLVDAEGSGTISFYLDRPRAQPAKIVLQHVLYVPACGTNYLLSIIELMWKRVNFEFNLDGAIAILGSVLVYQAPLINSPFILRTSPSTLTSSTSMVFDTLNQDENTEIYSGIWQKVDEKDIFVWHARLGHLSLPAI